MKIIIINEDNPMAEKHFEVSLPEEVLTGFGWEEAEVPGKLREALVMELLRRDDVTEAQAADLLQLDRWDLLETMRRYQVSAIRMSPEELRRELTQEIQLD
jgi:hypothetical protein